MRDNCSQCGKDVTRVPKSAEVIVCRDCQRARPETPKNLCDRCCLAPCSPGRGRLCAECRRGHGTWSGYQRHRLKGEPACEDCLSASRDRSREASKRNGPRGTKAGVCTVCGETVWLGSRSRPDPTCRKCRGQNKQDVRRLLICPACGDIFSSRLTADGSLQQCCSIKCAGWYRYHGPDEPYTAYSKQVQHRIKNAKRRKNILCDPARYTLAEIAERDDFTCQLCLGAVDMTLSGLDRNGPTIDHIIPLSISRDDRRTNVQLAHRGCNIAKGARVTAAQRAADPEDGEMLFGGFQFV